MDPDAQLQAPLAPATASIPRRVLGWSIDYTIVMVPGLTLVTLALVGMVHALPGHIGAVGADVGWSGLVRLIVHHGGGAHVVKDAAADEWTAFARPLIAALLAVPLLQFAYHATLLCWPGRTIGKIVSGTRVDDKRMDMSSRRRRLALRRALTTTTIETGLIGVALAATTLGHLYTAVTIWAVALVGFWINAFTLLGPRRRTIVDRLAGTVVIRSSAIAQVAERVRNLEAGRGFADRALAARDQASALAVTAGQLTFDAATTAGQLARESTGAIAASRTAQHAQALGVIGADKARQLGGQAADRARRLGGRAQQAWNARQAGREQQQDGRQLPPADRPDPPPPAPTA